VDIEKISGGEYGVSLSSRTNSYSFINGQKSRNLLCGGFRIAHFAGICVLFSQQVDLVLVLAFGWLFVNTLANAQWIFYHKTWNATVRCTQDGIEVLYKEELLRKVSWDSIHCVQVRDVNGFFYGQDRDRVKYTYICLFLNGNANIPEVSYNRKFFEKDFLMIGYRLELHEIILQHVTNR